MKRKSKIKKILKATAIIVVAALVITVIASLATGNSLFIVKTTNIDESKEYDLGDIQNIKIGTSFDNLKIISTDEDTIRVHYNGKYSSNDNNNKPYLSTEVRGDSLIISVKRKDSVSIGFNYTKRECELKVYIPEKYSRNIEIKTSFGDIDIDDLKVNEFICDASSGNVKINSLHTKTSNVNSSFGNITVKEFVGELNGKSSSGKYDVEFAELKYDVNIETSFGDIKLKFPKEANFDLDYKSSFEECTNAFPITITGDENDMKVVKGRVGNGGNEVKVRSSAGKLTITN